MLEAEELVPEQIPSGLGGVVCALPPEDGFMGDLVWLLVNDQLIIEPYRIIQTICLIPDSSLQMYIEDVFMGPQGLNEEKCHTDHWEMYLLWEFFFIIGRIYFMQNVHCLIDMISV